MLGVFHGARLAELDARHGGSIIDAQIARALADAPWPEALLADVASVTTDDFDLIDAATAISMAVWIWSPSRCGRDSRAVPGCSHSSCTRTCRGWPITAAGRSARNGSTSRGRRLICH